MNKSITEIIKIYNSKYRKFLILNNYMYQNLKKELGIEDYEELSTYKNLTICISQDDNLNIILV